MLSIVIPVYNSADIFPELYRRLSDTLSGLGMPYEIIAVTDGCTDGSEDIIAEFCRKDNHLRLLEFSRNFGHQMAVTAGLKHSSGDMVITMDDDLEDPPEVLPDLVKKAQEGYDIVYGVRGKRKVLLPWRLAYNAFYRLMNSLSGIDMPYDAGDFSLMKRPVVDKLNSMPETNRYIRGMRAWLGFRQVGIKYERGKRLKGVSGYSLSKYIRFALDGIFSFSYKPLQYVSILGFVIAISGFILGFRFLLMKLAGKIVIVQGWTTLILTILFIGGVQLIAMGVIGEYIARIFDEVKRRPKYVIKRHLGVDVRKLQDESSASR